MSRKKVTLGSPVAVGGLDGNCFPGNRREDLETRPAGRNEYYKLELSRPGKPERNTQRGMWRLTGFYGYPEGARRRDSWNFIRRLAQDSHLPWCIIGDFNDILSVNEKKGRNERPNWLIDGFRKAIIDAGLSDVHMEGYPFTWFKSLGTPRAVEEKLDRALANGSWFQMFPYAKVENLVAPASDHYPILLDRDPAVRSCRPQRKFKFENAWCLESGLDDVVYHC
ncbi:endonuclease/exonuclease/phosphatase family protein, partial [Trifolium pratense]